MTESSTYRVFLKPEVDRIGRKLPGMMRQRIRRMIDELAENPRPHNSIAMQTSKPLNVEPRRIRVDDWRILYVIDETWQEVSVIAIRQRPPYDYEDLVELLAEFETSDD
ncbi:MAG: type II toxin-antitoxin system RelE/ParE family toxin [Cyanobacteria bacterium CRU_2_1]|nr:type II toxin-antitoxin system RelE/ParE family toxin [Cyanobacteria bacterium RU_5_0]NJR57895.1 type II toxin-antitoxin system RelE/ParE family toxin [Cyanobacteria bacterium CRU_2_1]